ncbi:MAG TPA: LysM peptidoglycan-binding domain-containing protein [Ignavibacteria bacterium]
MKKKLFSLMLTGFILLSFATVGQKDNYPIKKIKGIEYYVYTVQASEGLLAIGRKFEISPEEISKLNPEIQNGLKAGQEILIQIQKKSTKKTESKSNLDFIQHKVEKKQTLFAISHKYSVSQEDIKKFNPNIKTGLSEGMILNIPDSTKIKKQKEAENKQIFKHNTTVSIKKQQLITHKVKKTETLFSICKQYNVDINEVIRLNPGSETKISVGSELKIPTNSDISKQKEQNKENVENSLKSTVDINKYVEKPNKTQYAGNKNIRIAFLLPFMLDQAKKELALERFQNFYAGALLAIQSAKEKGISFEIYTYDTDKTEEKMTEVLNNSELKTMDLIIGPAFSNQVDLVANFAKESKIKTLIPFTSKVPDIENNPYLFQFNPGSDTELKYMFELINGKLKNIHFVFAEVQGVSPLDDGKIREESLKIELARQRKSFGIIELGSSENINFSSELKKGEKNLIIFDTDKYSNVNAYIKALLSTSSEYDIVLFEQYSWNSQIEKKLESIYISPFISNLNEQLVDEYNTRFDQFFGKDVTNDSPRYDILGYDLTNYFITYINRFGSKFDTKIGSVHSIPGIQSQPLFERISNESGFINQRVYLSEEKTQ